MIIFQRHYNVNHYYIVNNFMDIIFYQFISLAKFSRGFIILYSFLNKLTYMPLDCYQTEKKI